MSLDSIVSVSITTAAAAISREGFGTPMIVGYHAEYADRVRTYTDLAGLVTDGFAVTDPIYLAAQAILSASVKVPQFKVGRRALAFTQTIELAPQDTTEDLVYTGTIDGLTWSYTVQAADTINLVCVGIKDAVNGLSAGPTAVESPVAPNAVKVVCTAAAADLHAYEDMNDRAVIEIVDVTADPGIATDLAAIQNVDADWYGLQLDSQSEAEVKAAAAWVETLRKVQAYASQDSDILDAAVLTDIVSDLQTASYDRTFGLYHPKPMSYPGAAWMGRVLPFDPGSLTWMFKALTGIDTYELTSTELAALEGKAGNWYRELGRVGVTGNGVMASGEFIDIIRGIDWLTARLQERIFGVLVNSDKIPFTDPGIAVVEAEVRAQLQEAIGVGLLAANPAPVVTVPKAADVSTSDKTARTLPDVEFSATLAGAIHKVEITGVVSV